MPQAGSGTFFRTCTCPEGSSAPAEWIGQQKLSKFRVKLTIHKKAANVIALFLFLDNLGASQAEKRAFRTDLSSNAPEL